MSGYSFKVEGPEGTGASGWMSADRVFTTPEFQKRYGSVRISLMTHKCTLVPEHFFSPADARSILSEVVALKENDHVDYVRTGQSGAVLVYSGSIGETLSKVIAQNVLTEDGYLHLVIAQGRSLMLANIFKAPDFTTAEYFIFNAMKKLQLNPEVSTICFRTPISPEEEISLYRYFKAVERI